CAGTARAPAEPAPDLAEDESPARTRVLRVRVARWVPIRETGGARPDAGTRRAAGFHHRRSAGRLRIRPIRAAGGSEAIPGVSPAISARSTRRSPCAARHQLTEAARLRRLRRSPGLGRDVAQGPA